MSNEKLTLDDILGEYAGSSANKTSNNTKPVDLGDLDSIIAGITADSDKKRRENDEIKRQKQIDYEIMSGDYEQKFMPDELKTTEQLVKENGEDYFRKSGDDLFNSLINDEYAKSQISDDDDDDYTFDYDIKKPVVTDSRTKKNEKEKKKKEKKEKKKISFGKGLLESIREKQLNDKDQQDEFEKKYGTPDSPLFTIDDGEVYDLAEEHVLPFDITNNEGISLSEKLAREDEYTEKYKSVTPKSVKPHKVKTTERPAEVYTAKKVQDADPLSKYAGTDVESILAEYDAADKNRANLTVKTDTSPLKGFTDIFNKLMAKEEQEGHVEGGELLESSKGKKPGFLHTGTMSLPRITSQTGTVPIERKTINDIDLQLEDKLIHDTAAVKISKKEKEKLELDKISALKERRREKVETFALIDDEIEIEEDVIQNEDVIEDYESLEDTSDISRNIEEQKAKLILRFIILLACFLATIFIALTNDANSAVLDSFEIFDRTSQPDVVLFINSVIGVLAGIFAFEAISNGISRIFTMKADSDSLPAVTLILSVITSLLTALNTNMYRGGFVNIYVPIAIGALLMNTLGKLLIIKRTERSFRFVSGDNKRYAMFIVEDEKDAQDYTRGALTDFPALASMQQTDVISDFLKTSYAPDSTDRFCKMVTPVIAIASVVIGIFAAVIARSEHGNFGALCVGFSAATCCFALCSSFSTMLITTLPMEKISRKYSEDGGAVIGFDCIDEFAETNSILVDAAQLFPSGSVKLVNIKAFPDTSIDEAIVEAASLTSQSGSVLKSMFYDIIVGKTELLNPVESYIFEDSLGLCGWINNKRVLLGGRDLMVNHSIEGLPSLEKEEEYTSGINSRIAVYLSISGQLSAMFVVEITPAYQVEKSLKELQKQGIPVMLRTVDSFLTVNRLSEIFGVTPSLFKLLPFRMHSRYEKTTEYTVKRNATLACTGKFTAYSGLIVSTNKMRGTISAGMILMAAQILLGILLSLTMALLGALEELTVTVALVYNIAFFGAYCLIQLFKRL